MQHKIRITGAQVEMIKSGILPFWIEDALKHDIQVAHFIDFESNESRATVKTQATYVTSRHQHYNHIVIGLKLVNELTDEQAASFAYTSPVLHAQLAQPKHYFKRCASKEDEERKKEIEIIIAKNSSDKLPLKTKKHLEALNRELKEIDQRFVDLHKEVSE